MDLNEIELLWLSDNADGTPDAISLNEEAQIVIPLSLDDVTDRALSNLVQENNSILVSAVALLGRVEAKIHWLSYQLNRDFDDQLVATIAADPELFKTSGRSVEVMRTFVRTSMCDEWKARDESLHISMTMRERLRKKVEAFIVNKENLRGQIELRKVEASKG